VVAGVEVEAEAEAITKKENGTAFSTRKTMITAQTIAQTRKGSKLSSKKRGRKKGERVM
jgi:tRNA A58 N-methylase Trm61